MVPLRFSVTSDRVCDVVPVISTISNLRVLYQKFVDFPKLSRSAIQTDRYYDHIDRKSFYRCVVLLVPVVGNICVVVCDLASFYSSPRTIQPKSDLNIAGEFQTVKPAVSSRFARAADEEKENRPSSREGNQSDQLYLIQLSNNLDQLSRNYRESQSFGKLIQVFMSYHNNPTPQTRQGVMEILKSLDRDLQNLESDLYLGKYNGFREGNNRTYCRLAGLESVAESPLQVTGLLGLEAGLESSPNWILHRELIQIFLEKVEGIREIFDGEQKLDEEMKKTLLGICARLSTHYQKLRQLLYQVTPLIDSLREAREALLKKAPEKQDNYDEQRSRFQKDVVARFQWDGLRLVGSKKFYLRDALFGQPFHHKIASFGQEMSQESSRSPIVRIAQAGSSTIYGALGYYFAGPWGLLTGLVPAFVAEAEGSRLKRHWRHEIDKIQTPFDLLNKPSIDPASRAPIGLNEGHIILDLQTREIEWINRPLNGSEVVLAKISALAHDPVDGIFVQPRNFFKTGVLQVIQGQTGADLAYDGLLQRLVGEYRECITSMVDGKSVDRSNCLQSLAEGVIVGGVEKGQIPLVFPKKLLLELEKKLGSQQKGAPLIPFYNFSTETGELTIEYKLDLDPNSAALATFRVAKFDLMTIQAFRSDLKSNSPDFSPNEFLLQAMYGGLIRFNLGLPGKGSLQLKSGLISPQETPYEGCYSLWEKSPGKMIFYDSSTYDGSKQAIDLTMAFEPALIRSSQYAAVMKESGAANKMNRMEYDRLHQVLRGVVKLISDIRWGEIQKKLDENDISEEIQKIVLDNPSPAVIQIRQMGQKMNDIVQWLGGSVDRQPGLVEQKQ